MPNCFQLIPKGSSEPEALAEVDRKMCEHFKVPCHEKDYYHYWYDRIGFPLACGTGFKDQLIKLNEELVKYPEEAEWTRRTIEIVEWMDANYTTDAWAEIGRGK